METTDSGQSVRDFIGIGFGPSNLALAVAAQERAPRLNGLFFECGRAFSWHAELLFDHSRMQISFLKDLVTLRNPSSPYSFLAYARARGRLERFVNLSEFHPTRIEYQDYLRWVADQFSRQVRYGSRVRAVVPRLESRQPHYEVIVEDVSTGRRTPHRALNVVTATGGTVRLPDAVRHDDPRIVQSSQFLSRFYRQFADREANAEFVIVGGGQSGAEIAIELLRSYPNSRVHMLVAGYSLRAVDRSPFVNEVFSSAQSDAFFAAEPDRKAAILRELRDTNYGVVSADLLDKLYQHAYLAQIKGAPQFVVHAFSRLIGAEADASSEGLQLAIQDRISGNVLHLRCDGVVLATGYTRRLDPEIFADVLPLLKCDAEGNPRITQRYRAETHEPTPCGLYVQGLGESSHGLGDTLLSLLPFRSEQIVTDIVARPAPSAAVGDYPPARHLENDTEMLQAFLERYPFATLISARGTDDPVVTQLPLILDRARGEKGVLFGHMDRSNPHAELLDSRHVMAIFHGPNSYISPLVYQTRQLPTWNSMSVHLWGRVRRLDDNAAVVRGLQSICERTDPGPDAFRLDEDDPRIAALIDGIVGFEIDIDHMLGRFKLSQDRSAEDCRRAAHELMHDSPERDRAAIETALRSICPVASDSLTPARPVGREETHSQ